MTLYIAKDGQRLGPYSPAEVQSLVAAGNVLPSDFAWYEGLADWIPLAQVPGYNSPAAAAVAAPALIPPSQPAQRPVLVWVICLFFFICTPFSLVSLALMPMFASGAIPVQEAQRHYFQSQNAFDYGLVILNTILVLTWAVLLFMLRRVSLYVFLGSLGLSILVLIYNIVAKDWLGAVGTAGLIGAGFSWVINLLILYYNWHLFRKGVLR